MKKAAVIIICYFISIFISNFVVARELNVRWKDGLIPGGNNAHGSLTCQASRVATALNKDRTEHPTDVVWSDDGLIVYTVNEDDRGDMNGRQLSMNKVAVPFLVTSDLMTSQGEDVTCDAIDGDNVAGLAGGPMHTEQENILIQDDGKIFFILDRNGDLGKFNASTAFDIDGLIYEREIDFSTDIDSVAFSTEGTKLYTLSATSDTPVLTTFELPGANDISSKTQIHQVNLTTLGIDVDNPGNDIGSDVEFSEDGFAMFILMRNENFNSTGTDLPYSYMYQFRLDVSFDVSTAEKVGRWNVEGFGNITNMDNRTGIPEGFTFSPDGMMLFIVQSKNGVGTDQVNRFDLECPYGVVECVSATTSTFGTTVELAKQNIGLNTTTIFKRFEWIKRNRDEENLTSHNLNFNYKNTLVDTLANKFEPVARKNIASLISKTKNEDKKSKWSTWSLVDVYVGLYGQHGSEKPKDILVKGITLGADRKYGDDKFLGLALRYGDSSSDIKNSKQNVTMESLTLNLYGIAPTQHNQYVNAVLGLSYLSIDHIYQSKLSGERHGGQIFGTLNYRTRSKAGRFNMTPTAKLTYGITHLSEFTDYINNPSDPVAKNLTYKDTDFATGELAAGFLFEMDEYVTDMGTIQPMGGLEILYDLSEDIDYKYIYHGETNVVTDTIRKYSNQDIKYNIGFETIYLNGFTISSSFEKIISWNDRKDPNRSRERFILKFSRSKEEDGEFAFNYNPVNAHESSLSYSKNINGFDFSINHNQIFEDSLKYDTNVEVSSAF